MNLLGDPLAPIGVDDVSDIPILRPSDALVLYPSSPNPFNPATNIRFSLSEQPGGAVRTTVHIHDLSGRSVVTVLDQYLESDDYEIPWNGCDAHGQRMASGTYVVVVQAGRLTASEKLTLVK